MTYTLLIHGGAGNIQPKNLSEVQRAAHEFVLKQALETGGAILEKGGAALDAVEVAVTVLEDSPLFNAGKGAVFTAEGKQEMDACIMEGTTRHAGAVTGVQHLRNPIQAARLVLEHSPHILLSGNGAEKWCLTQGAQWAEADYFFDQHRWDQLQAIIGTEKTQLDFADDPDSRFEKVPESRAHSAPDKYGTVGAVACDAYGHVAAATSTGGMTNKLPGRVGDSPIIGAGCYADDGTCAVSTTGQGEYFMRGMIAQDVAARMKYQGLGLEQAAQAAIAETLEQLKGRGGLIAVDAKGNFAMPFNTSGMFRGVAASGKKLKIQMFKS